MMMFIPKQLLVALFITLVPSLVQGQDTLAIIQEAKHLITVDQYKEALVSLDDCDYRSCQFTKADILYRQGIYAEAKIIFEELIKADFQSFSCSKFLSKIYESEGNVPKAVSHYSTLAKQDTTNAIYQRKLGNLYAKSGYTLESLAAYNKALSLNPKDIISITALSEMLFNLDQVDQADSIITKGHKLDSTNINVQLIRSRIAYKQKKYKEVTDILYGIRGRLDLDDYSSKILGFSLVKIDSFERALFTLHKVLLNDPEAESVHYYLGLAYEKLNQPKEASSHFERALAAGISAQTDLYHRKLAKIANDKKDWPSVIHHYKRSLQYEENPEIYFLLAMATDNYYKDKSTSVRYYKKYIESNHDNPQWQKYALERRKYLKEIAFLQKN